MIYDDEVFQMACDQFQVIADYLNIDKNDRDRLMYPKRAMAVTLPVHMVAVSLRPLDAKLVAQLIGGVVVLGVLVYLIFFR